MADITNTGIEGRLSLGSHQTAIAVLLPPSSPQHQIISTLRSLYANGDKTWPWPHVNLLYPFVSPRDLPKAVSTIQTYLASRQSQHGTLRLTLDTQGSWKHKDHATIYLGSSASRADDGISLQSLRNELVGLFSSTEVNPANETPYVYTPHMTIGNTSLHEELIEDLSRKARTLIENSKANPDGTPGVSWDVERLVVLQRSSKGSVMQIVGEILLNGEAVENLRNEIESWTGMTTVTKPTISNPVYQFSTVASDYIPYVKSHGTPPPMITELKVLSYNILTDAVIPAASTTARYPLLLKSILSLPTTSASILALQEVTDDFLAYLLAQPAIRARYPFSTHSPTHNVLPSLRNCVTLSSIPFGDSNERWEWVDLGKRHKGAVVIEVDIDGNVEGQEEGDLPNSGSNLKKLVIANVHLTCGMSDTSIATKVSQLKIITSHFRNRKASKSENWVLVGDFNFPTSHATATTAYTSKLISSETYQFLLSDHGRTTHGKGFIPEIWQDTYTLTHAHNEISDVEELKFDILKGNSAPSGYGWEALSHNENPTIGLGEFGATFNPFTNPLAAEQVKWGANPRPQRYDRILIARSNAEGSALSLETKRTGRFGFEGGSDHWGVFADFNIRHGLSTEATDKSVGRDWLRVDKTEPVFLTNESLEAFISENGMSPSPKDYAVREEARDTLVRILTNEGRQKSTISDISQQPPSQSPNESQPQDPQAPSIRIPFGQTIGPSLISKPSIKMVIQPVGSYYMNLFTPASDLDILCASNISPRLFWVLAKQRIRRHGRRMAKMGRKDGIVKVLRYVEAQSGTMMELEYIPTKAHHDLEEVDSTTEEGTKPNNTTGSSYRVRIDLQYCQVPERVLDSWQQLPSIPSSDPLFSLSVSSLKKINAYRDSAYLLQTIPNLKLFRLTFRALKLWAVRRGIFAARFGYLGGIHLVLLLSRVFKRVSPDQVMDLTAGEILKLFFQDYAGFNYTEDVVADINFGSAGYRRSGREPFAVTTPHAPIVNVAHTASKHTLKTLRDEILLANQRIGRNCGWDAVTGTDDGDAEREFLNAFGNFVKIDIHYWGRNIPRGRSLVGWIESRCVNLLVELNEKVPNIHARLWPGRFVDISEAHATEELRGFYLIGLTNAAADAAQGLRATAEPTREALEQRRLAFNRFNDILRSFEAYLQDEQKRYEVTESFISVDRITRQAVGDNVRIDKHIWWDEEYETMGTANAPGEGSYYPNDDGADDYDSLDDEDGLSDDEDDQEEGGFGARRPVQRRGGHIQGGMLDTDGNEMSEHRDLQGIPTVPHSTTRRQRNKQQQQQVHKGLDGSESATTTISHDIKKPKLRPAHDIINRIKWDPEMDVDQYILGYEDRFLGVMETPVGKWIERRGGDETDEDWVPLHRVLYVRRAEDGVKVWDRDQRIDTIFGSGGA